MTPELDPTALRSRAKRGVVFLAARAVAVQVIALAGTIALARKLTAAEFGTFGIVQFVLTLFTLFGDVGLGAALIQRREAPDHDELSSVFWAQVLFAALVVAGMYALSPWVVGFWPDLPGDAVDLVRMLSLSFVFVMLRAVPSVLLERNLSFGKLAILELVSTLAFYGVATAFAYLGYGVRAMLWAVVIQALASLIAAYAFYPWWPRWAFKPAFVKSALRYGVAYQTKNLVGFANAAVVPLVAGRLIGTEAVGYFTWAQSAAYQPLRVVQLLNRVNFPLLSRFQDDPAAFRRFVERGLQLSALATFVFVAVCLGVGEHLVRLIYGERWLPALPVFYVLVASVGVAFIAPMITSALEAMGKPQLTAGLSLAWMVLNWGAVLLATVLHPTPFAFTLGYVVHVVVGNLALLVVFRRHVPGFRVTRGFLTAAFAAILAAAVGHWVTPDAPAFLTVVGVVLLVTGVFAGVTFLANPQVYRDLANIAGLGRLIRRFTSGTRS